MKKILFLMSTVLFLLTSCGNEDIPQGPMEEKIDPVFKMLKEYYSSINPEATRSEKTFRIKTIDRRFYSVAGDSAIETPETRGNDSIFDVTTVNLQFDKTEGYALLSSNEKINRVFYFTDNGCLSDTANIEPLKEYIEKVPCFASYELKREKNETRASENDIVLGPLVKTKWGQAEPFNRYTPVCNCNVCKGHNPIGCVATATAQFIRHSINFGGTFYGNRRVQELPATVYEMNENQKNLVAQFFHEVALCCQTKFECGGSHSQLKAAWQYLKDLGYYADYIEKGIDVERLKKELTTGIPHLIGGRNKSKGHVWLIDGIRTSGDFYDFHCNWGSVGQSDGWMYGNPCVSSDGERSYTYDNRNIYILWVPFTSMYD